MQLVSIYVVSMKKPAIGPFSSVLVLGFLMYLLMLVLKKAITVAPTLLEKQSSLTVSCSLRFFIFFLHATLPIIPSQQLSLLSFCPAFLSPSPWDPDLLTSPFTLSLCALHWPVSQTPETLLSCWVLLSDRPQVQTAAEETEREKWKKKHRV